MASSIHFSSIQKLLTRSHSSIMKILNNIIFFRKLTNTQIYKIIEKFNLNIFIISIYKNSHITNNKNNVLHCINMLTN